MDTAEEPNEEELAAHARSGDQEAMLSLLDLYDGLVRARVTEMLPDAIRRRVAVSDVMQETRIEALQSVDRFEWRGDGSFRGWLLAVANNQARKAIRRHLGTQKRSRRREITRSQRLSIATHALQDLTASKVAMAQELEEKVRDALDALPADYREVLLLCRGEDLTIREAALQMGRSREATKKLYARALTRFARVLRTISGVTDEP